MDLQRILLIGAIAALSFMLMTEWVSFKQEHTAAAQSTESRQLTVPDNTAAAAPTASAPADDLPETPVPTEAQAAPKALAASDRLVHIRTDALQLVVDLQGGDIIELSLPQHLEQLDDPGQPFVLLEHDAQLTYIARSGLLGPDGIDSNGRAHYQVAQPRFELAPDADTLVVDLVWQNESPIKVTKSGKRICLS